MNELVDIEILLVVLVDGFIVLVFEIVLGFLQDFDWVIVVGSCMYGKGLVQVFCELFYNSSMKVIIVKYYIFSG